MSPRDDCWTAQQEKTLLDNVSIAGVSWLTRRTGRSRGAIYAKLRRACGGGGLTRGAYTLRRMLLLLQYDRKQVRRAQAALGQKWKRLGPRGAHIITDEQMWELATWLAHDYWAPGCRRYSCVLCDSAEREHKARGLCVVCYYRYAARCRRIGFPWRRKEQLLRLKHAGALPHVDLARWQQCTARMSSGIVIPWDDVVWLVDAERQGGAI